MTTQHAFTAPGLIGNNVMDYAQPPQIPGRFSKFNTGKTGPGSSDHRLLEITTLGSIQNMDSVANSFQVHC